MRKRRPLVVVTVALCVCVAVSCGDGGSDHRSTPTSTSVSTLAPATTTTAATAPTTLDATPAPWSLPAPVSREVGLTDGTGLIVLGGQDAAHVSTTATYRIDPSTGAGSPLGALAPAVHDAAGVRLGDRSIVIAGGTPPARATVQVLSDTGPAQPLGALPAPRTDHVAVLVDGTIYVFGGADAAEAPLASVLAGADGATWRAAGNLAEAVRYPAIAIAGDAIYLFGGVGAAHQDSTAVQRYDPATGATRVVARLPAALSHASAFVFGDAVFVVGGFVTDQPSTQILRFDSATDAITTAGTLPAPITDAAAVVIGGTGYLIGGEGPGRATSAGVVVLRPH
jgi:Kelch motif/Galactose oxidase, central domain